MEDAGERKRFRILTNYESFVKEQSKCSFCGTENYDTNGEDPFFGSITLKKKCFMMDQFT